MAELCSNFVHISYIKVSKIMDDFSWMGLKTVAMQGLIM